MTEEYPMYESAVRQQAIQTMLDSMAAQLTAEKEKSAALQAHIDTLQAALECERERVKELMRWIEDLRVN